MTPQEIQAHMRCYQEIEDGKALTEYGLTPDQQAIKERFKQIGFRIGIDEYGNVALYLMELVHPNVFGNM